MFGQSSKSVPKKRFFAPARGGKHEKAETVYKCINCCQIRI